jgi:hypothetical protein
MSRKRRRPEVVAIYCPLWHNYDHASSWKGEGWCEWELAKAAVPRFPGHYQPLRPSWGFFDESDPKWSKREIELAAEHGIDVFLFDWYWYSGVRIMEEALERGFLRTPARRRIKFALMWANHDWSDYFPPPFGKPWNMWLPSRHTPGDLTRVVDYCIEHYFRRANYWQVHGRLFFSIFQPVKFANELGGPQSTRKLLRRMDRRLRDAGLPPLHWNAMLWGPDPVPMLKEAGFRSTTSYVVNTDGKARPDLTERYEDVMDGHRRLWEQVSAAPLPYLPVVSMGWDVTPRCEKDIPWPFPPSPATGRHDYPYMSVVLGNTPQLYEQLCRDAAEHMASDKAKPFAVLLNAWNEWTEGSYLLPEERTGMAYLEAIRRVFGK